MAEKTREEQQLIDAVLAYTEDPEVRRGASARYNAMVGAADRLRESLKPKPRFVAQGQYVFDRQQAGPAAMKEIEAGYVAACPAMVSVFSGTTGFTKDQIAYHFAKWLNDQHPVRP